jgi:hypothetical protein
MKKKLERQGNTTNKLIVTFKDYSEKPFGTERQSFRCNSEDAAMRILGKRDKRRIYFAKWFNEKGVSKTIDINTKDTILAI